MRVIGLGVSGILVAAAFSFAAPRPLFAQDAGAEAEAEVEAGAADLLTDEDLDDLVAPVALYPDALLAQVLVASTYPLDVIKAQRFLEDNAEAADSDRADLAEAQPWDPSIQVLAAGFPTVITRMADDLDWTEALGDAALAQSDDVLDAVQRMRSRAAETGYLDSNEAQTVTVEGDNISIQPADPEVVYVPSYDPNMAFTSAPTAAPVVYQDGGITNTDLLTTGAIAFGGAMLLGEIFDDDDGGDNYWRGPPPIDWDDDAFYPRRGMNVDGDVNVDIDRNRVNIDRDMGEDGRFQPSPERRQQARDKIAARPPGDGSAAERARQRAAAQGGDGAARERLQARSQGGDGAARERVQAARSGDGNDAARDRLRAAANQPRAHDGALRPRAESPPAVRREASRGTRSADRANHPAARSGAAARHDGGGRRDGANRNVSRPQQARAPARHGGGNQGSAFKRPKGGHNAHAAGHRGGKSKGGGGGGRRHR